MSPSRSHHEVDEVLVKGDQVIEKLHGKTVATKDYQRVLSGYHATISNPRTSQEAKEHAEQMIAELENSHAQSISGTASAEHHDQHYNRVVGGLKASLKNEHVKGETKEEIRKRLEEMGEEYED